jgi:hypothetical protein
MPPISETIREHIARGPANTTSPVSAALEVVCAFPVSGQYGVGSRIVSIWSCLVLSYEAYVQIQLYYVLVITCIFARKAEWLRGACLYVKCFHKLNAGHALMLYTIIQSCSVSLPCSRCAPRHRAC